MQERFRQLLILEVELAGAEMVGLKATLAPFPRLRAALRLLIRLVGGIDA